MKIRTRQTTVLYALVVLVSGSAACGKVYKSEVASTFELPAGTQLMVEPTRAYDFEDLAANSLFTGVLAAPLTAGGSVIAPKGAPVSGAAVLDGAAEGGYVPVGVELTSITIHGGDEAKISTAPIFPQAPPDPEVDSEIREDRVLAFVLDEPATFEWSMDPSVDDKELKPLTP